MSIAARYLAFILSWQGRYNEARVELERVLAWSPGYYDAMLGLIRV